MGAGNRGPVGGSTNNPVIDPGTMCLQTSMPPGPTGAHDPVFWRGMDFLPKSVSHKGPIVVGLADRLPGLNFDGTVAEDMKYADKPAKSAAIRQEKIFNESDDVLEDLLRDLMESLSVGQLETVALEMADRFIEGKGGTYSNVYLNREIIYNRATLQYQAKFEQQLNEALKECQYDPTRIKVVPMSLLNFSSLWDKVGGLGITVHQVWSARAHFENYRFDLTTRAWSGQLVLTFYDHFGLDWEDIVKHGNDTMPSIMTGFGFKAWYILQHYRKAKPFVTEMQIITPSAGRSAW